VESPKLSTDVLGHLAFAALRAAEAAKWGEVTLSAGVHHAGRSLFANVFDAQALRKEALSKRISELASRAAALTPADLMPAWLAVSTSELEEVFQGPSIHVHGAVTAGSCVVTVSSPDPISNPQAFVSELTARLVNPNPFD
jgi:hypothetical protein